MTHSLRTRRVGRRTVARLQHTLSHVNTQPDAARRTKVVLEAEIALFLQGNSAGLLGADRQGDHNTRPDRLNAMAVRTARVDHGTRRRR